MFCFYNARLEIVTYFKYSRLHVFKTVVKATLKRIALHAPYFFYKLFIYLLYLINLKFKIPGILQLSDTHIGKIILRRRDLRLP